MFHTLDDRNARNPTVRIHFTWGYKYGIGSADFKTASEFTGEGKAMAFLAMARTEEARGQLAKATELYEKVGTEFPNTEYARNAKNQVRRLKSPLFAGDKAATKKG